MMISDEEEEGDEQNRGKRNAVSGGQWPGAIIPYEISSVFQSEQ